MADGIQVTFPDMDALISRMSGLSSNVQRSIARRSTAKGLRVVRDKAIENAQRIDNPVTKNNISKNIRIKWAGKLAKKEGGAAYQLGVMGGGKSRLDNESNPGGDTYYWRFLEFGTAKMAAKPFMRPAINQMQQTALKVAMDEALRLINVEAKKVA